jgi:hypothetical protein
MQPIEHPKRALRIMDNDRKFTEAAKDNESHNVGEIWSGAFWEIRARVGQSATDKLLYSTWTAMPFKGGTSFNASFASALIDAARALPNGDRSGDVAAIFKHRKFKL